MRMGFKSKLKDFSLNSGESLSPIPAKQQRFLFGDMEYFHLKVCPIFFYADIRLTIKAEGLQL